MSGGTRLRLVRRPLGRPLASVDALRLVRADAHPVALFGSWAGGADVVAAEPVAVRAAPGPLADVFDAPFPPGGPEPDKLDGLSGGEGGEGAFGGGWIGYLGYSAGGEALPASGPRRLPAWWFGYYDHVLRRDPATGQWFFEALCADDRADAVQRRFAELARRAAAPGPAPPGYEFGPFRLTPGATGHRQAVREAVAYIHAGDIFQANICLRAEAEFTGDPLDAFCRGVTELQPPYAAFIGVSPAVSPAAGPAAGPPVAPRPPRSAVVSLSPELFLRRERDTVTSKPIKGTARRDGDPGRAAAQRERLAASAKNRAENVMIVDLVRNDLSRVCVPGTVTVPLLLGAEPHPGVWHLVSTVEGALRPGATDGDLLRAAFPPGSVTGAPKVRALEIIDELELAPREAYTGAIGYRSPLAGLELNVAIRTFEFAAGRAWLGAGGGIVADSDPAAEYAECLIKATPLVAALGAALDTSAAAAAPDTGGMTGLAALMPHPAAGVFTSLLVTGGRTTDLAGHLARLAASVRALYGKDLPESLHAELARCLAGRPDGRLRITVRPVGGPLQVTVEVVPLSPVPRDQRGTREPAGVTLRPVTVTGGLGAHKYRDRRLLAELARRAALAPGAQLLLTDETGELLETDRASLFAVIDGVLVTPPADGRILPGTTRAAILRAANERCIRVGRKPLTPDDLAAATEVFVTNAVAGVLPVRAVDGYPRTWAPGPVTARLAAALADRPHDSPHDSPHDCRHDRPRDRPGLRLPVSAELAELAELPGPVKSRVSGEHPLVILIDNYDSFTWNLAHLLTVSGARVEVVRNDEVTAAQVTAAAPAGVVISPGPCAPAEAGISVAAVRAAAAAGVPLLGICLGHQAIAAAFGAVIVRAPRPVHGQPSGVRHDGRGVLAGLPDPFEATRYHSLVVAEATLPPELEITARTEGIPMGLRHRTLPVEGVQFHPESILTPHGGRIIGNFLAAARRGTAAPDARPGRTGSG